MANDVINFWQLLPCFSQRLDNAECQSTSKKFSREANLERTMGLYVYTDWKVKYFCKILLLIHRIYAKKRFLK